MAVDAGIPASSGSVTVRGSRAASFTGSQRPAAEAEAVAPVAEVKERYRMKLSDILPNVPGRK